MENSGTNKQPITKKRALILAGGGLKVAFQAGVLQVWLDEAGIDFALADGVSGGVLNAAMFAQGMTGTEIANNWRHFDPLRMVSLNWLQLPKFLGAESLLTFNRFRQNILLEWDLDFYRIRKSKRDVTFNAYNFSTHQLEVWTEAQVTEEFLLACIALPIWFPPLVIAGSTYIDAIYILDANLEEAIARGADELWVIWTVNKYSTWVDGFLAHYFQIVETSANGHLQRMLQRIEKSNASIATYGHGEFPRHITVKQLEAKVPVHYLINFSHKQMRAAVELGVKMARTWCREHDIPIKSETIAQTSTNPTILKFSETMKGFFAFGETDYDQGYLIGRQQEVNCTLNLTIYIRDLEQFLTDHSHRGRVIGTIHCDALGAEQRIDSGVVNLLVDEGNSSLQTMRYRLFFTDGAGHPLTLIGVKFVKDDPGFDIWSDTTTLFTRIFQGHVERKEEAILVASGILKLSLIGFLRQLTTFRTSGIGIFRSVNAFGRFGRFFLDKLAEIYRHSLLPIVMISLTIVVSIIGICHHLWYD